MFYKRLIKSAFLALLGNVDICFCLIEYSAVVCIPIGDDWDEKSIVTIKKWRFIHRGNSS